MHAYVNGSWREGYLDQAPSSDRPLVVIRRQVALVPAAGQYFVREPQLAMLFAYVRRLGLRRVLRKVRSRRREAVRNDAWLSVGIGSLHGLPTSRPVAFVLTSSPVGVERAVVPRELLFELPAAAPELLATGHFMPAREADPAASLEPEVAQALFGLAGWRPEAGTCPVLSEATIQAIGELVRRPGAAFVELPPCPTPSEVCHRIERVTTAPARREGKPTYHCFGFGQYAKTQVVPNLGFSLGLACVHEIDPFQIGPVLGTTVAHDWDTLPSPRRSDLIENAVIATYHHTHATIAIELLDKGARHIIIEKPIATSTSQLSALLAAIERRPSAKVHSAFQRRYSPFNKYLVEDLNGVPISMAATVYEVPLPERHWYRWPVVGNAIVSNGCHWIDHFLFLNAFSRVTSEHVQKLSTQVVLGLELENGASASISLRHEGAPRRGVRDQCVFWKGDASAVIEDSRRYTAEQGFRQVRRARAHPYKGHELMYREFAHRIELDLAGDAAETIRMSTESVLELARLLDEQEGSA